MAAGDQTIQILGEIVEGILAKVDNLDPSIPDAEQVLLQEIYVLLDQFGLTVKDVLAPEILMAYFSGVDEATQEILEAGLSLPPISATGTAVAGSATAVGAATTAITPDGMISKPFQKVIHIRAVENIIDDTMMDMSAAINTAKRSANTAIMGTLADVRGDLAEGLIRGNAQNTTIQKVAQTFRERGMTSFTTADNKELPLRYYAMTVARTKTRTATVQGSMNRYREAPSVKFVQINGNGDSCEVCSRYNGMVIAIGNKPVAGFLTESSPGVRMPPFHPNCRCAIRPWRKDDKTEDEILEAKKRRIEFMRNPNADRRTSAQKAAYEDEQRRRRIANAEIKQYMRWQTLLGAEAPKTIGAFRAMKRKNSPTFQRLQGQVRSQAAVGATLQGSAYRANKKKPLNKQTARPAPTAPREFVTPKARERFREVTDLPVPADMSTNASRKKYATALVDKAGLGHLRPTVTKSKTAYGQVSYFTNQGTIETVGMNLMSNDNRVEGQKLRTLYHEFYHANYHGLDVGNSGMTSKERVTLEETATETAAAFMMKEKGHTEFLMPAYADHLTKNLPRLKQLDEFKDCEMVEDFGAVFMKYRFDDDYKTADWRPLHDQLNALGKQDMPAYFSKNYHKYIQDNIDTIMPEVAGAFDVAFKDNPAMIERLKAGVQRGIDAGGQGDMVYELAVMYAMAKIGVR